MEGGISQVTERTERGRHSLPVERKSGYKLVHRKKASEGTHELSSKREQVKALKEAERVRGTHCLSSGEGGLRIQKGPRDVGHLLPAERRKGGGEEGGMS